MGRNKLKKTETKKRRTYRLYDWQVEILEYMGDLKPQHGLDLLINYCNQGGLKRMDKIKNNTCHDK